MAERCHIIVLSTTGYSGAQKVIVCPALGWFHCTIVIGWGRKQVMKNWKYEQEGKLGVPMRFGFIHFTQVSRHCFEYNGWLWCMEGCNMACTTVVHCTLVTGWERKTYPSPSLYSAGLVAGGVQQRDRSAPPTEVGMAHKEGDNLDQEVPKVDDAGSRGSLFLPRMHSTVIVYTIQKIIWCLIESRARWAEVPL